MHDAPLRVTARNAAPGFDFYCNLRAASLKWANRTSPKGGGRHIERKGEPSSMPATEIQSGLRDVVIGVTHLSSIDGERGR
ncbi:MAG TPA: hypothetical protein VEJ20_09590, partial [Candidatus Eremiobacteraceae bacterium]|nr:hypothetical protein [Candidatus Eremiobacteraceae bacterium]